MVKSISKTDEGWVKMAHFVFGNREKAIIREIAKGKKIAAVALKNGLHRCTIHRWLQREEVQKYLEFWRLQEELKTLRDLTKQLDAPNPWVAFRAAQKILEMECTRWEQLEAKTILVSEKR